MHPFYLDRYTGVALWLCVMISYKLHIVLVIAEYKQSPYADHMHRLQQSFTAAYQRIDEEC